MAKPQPVASEESKNSEQNGHEAEVAKYEQELSEYLQERIRPGLNSGAIPLLARSIAKEIAHRDRPEDAAKDTSEASGDEASEKSEADDEPKSTSDDDQPDFEADMHELQAELGEDWILRFSVQGDEAWLTAEKDDGSQRVEAPTADVISQAVQLINESGGRSG